MARIPVEAVKALPIEQVAGHFGIQVRRRGRYLTALCPAHEDQRLGNMVIDPKRNSWYCFACGNGGSSIDLVKYHKRVDYVQALRLIADAFGIVPIAEERVSKVPRARLTYQDYCLLGLSHVSGKYGNDTISLSDDPELHDFIVLGKVAERGARILEACNRVMSDASLQMLLGVPLGELPCLLHSAKKEKLIELLKLAGRGFVDASHNPFPSPEEYQRTLANNDERIEHDEIVLTRDVG